MKNDDVTFWTIFGAIIALAGVWLAVSWFFQQWWSIPLLIGLTIAVGVFVWHKYLRSAA